MVPTYMAFFREGLRYTERAGAEPRWLAIAGNALDPGALATFASPYLTALKFPPRNPRTVAKDQYLDGRRLHRGSSFHLKLVGALATPAVDLAMVTCWNYRFFPGVCGGRQISSSRLALRLLPSYPVYSQ